MANCAVCSVELGFSNKVPLGLGNLSTGETLCLKCAQALTDAGFKGGPGKYTLTEVKPIIAEKRKLNTETVEKGSDLAAKSSRIQAQLEKIGVTRSSLPLLWGKKEVEELPNIIGENEEIFALVKARYGKGEGILAATDQRLLYIDKGGFLSGIRVEDFWLRGVTSIQYNSDPYFAELTIMFNGVTEKITYVDKDAGRILCDKIRNKLDALSHPVAAPTVINQAAPIDVADQLQKLAGLKAQGILTQEEFDGQKKKLLGL